MKIPCKNCLVLPICKNKVLLECDLIHCWMSSNYISNNEATLFRSVRQYIPYVAIISASKQNQYKMYSYAE